MTVIIRVLVQQVSLMVYVSLTYCISCDESGGSISGLPTYIGSNPWGQSTQTGYSDEHLTTIQSTAGLTWDLSRLVTKGLSVKGHFSFDFITQTKH